MTYSAAIVGCGRIGSTMADDPLLAGDVITHAEGYSKHPATDLIALCDADETRLREAGRRWGVRGLFSRAREMMQHTRAEVVSVCTPTATHRDLVLDLLAGEHVPRAIVCEKPLAQTSSDAVEMVNAARRRGVVLATVFMRRYAENFRSARDLISSGTLGRIHAVSGWYISGVLHSGTHWFDMLRFFGEEVEWVHGINVVCDSETDPTLDVAMRLRSGGLATLRACDSRNYSLFEMDIALTGGRIQITDSGHSIRASKPAPSLRYTGYTELQPVEYDFGHRRNLMLNAVDDIVRALRTGTPPACTGEDGVAAVRIAEAAIKSWETGPVVEL